ncbi:tripartite tricarboxylate transporter TctB family protein [Sporosarcina sp. P1]|uniref:tripartite tricarboxylate transporter TctB family protein n=1 Tax=Sporosarcina sp. P1 TaxID=2048257 RepID=UPI000C16413E|nr:tripartite tricarboxylate transporter TctB family protein [Sporosarcina sp. P1]PIC83004.1 hypothetical protein CSV73_09775 [Sporosarcina sp. P1]
MSKKKLDIIVLLLLSALGGYYIYSANGLYEVAVEGEVKSSFFPMLLGTVLIIFCVVGILKRLKKEEETVSFEGIGKIALTIGIVIAYFLIWQFAGYFYVLTFLLLFVLFTIYRKPIGMKLSRLALVNLAVSAGLILFIYFLFNNLMYIDF